MPLGHFSISRFCSFWDSMNILSVAD